MQLVWNDTLRTTILVRLEAGETLGGLVGPTAPNVIVTVPAAPGNREYDQIVAEQIPIAGYGGVLQALDEIEDRRDQNEDAREERRESKQTKERHHEQRRPPSRRR